MIDLFYRYRLGLIMNVDMIFVFGKDDEGCVVFSEVGIYVELLKRKGMYVEFWDSYIGKNGFIFYGSYCFGMNIKKYDFGVFFEVVSDLMRFNVEVY